MRLVTTWFGCFLLDEGKIVRALLFPKDPAAISQRLQVIEDWKVLDEERTLLGAAPEVFVSEPRLERAGGHNTAEEVPFLRAEDHGFEPALLHRAMLLVAKARMRKAPSVDDHLSQTVEALDDVTDSYNVVLERLREWYGLHYPELAKLVDDRTFSELISTYGDRAAIGRDEESIGGELAERDRLSLMGLAATARLLAAQRDALLSALEKSAKERAPNVVGLVGPSIAAHLISLAGGLDELARLPSSTIQVLGAEKAFFRHLKDGVPPPKHGVIFQHPLLHRAPPWQRGSLARAIAGKVSLAAKADAFTRRDLGEILRASLEKAAQRVAETKKAPRPRPSRPRGKPRRR